MTQNPPSARPEIVLAEINDKHFLIDGEDHMNAMIIGDAPYPTPVLSLRFETTEKIEEVLGDDFNAAQYWKINDRVIDRLRQESALIEMDA